MTEVSIPGRDIVALLRFEAKKKPAVAALIEAAQDMTDAEIDALSVPLPWYRKALKKMRNVRDHANLAAAVNANAVEVQLNDRDYGSIREYTGETRFIVTSAAGGSLEVKTGQLLWFPEDGGVWIDTVFAANIDQNLAASIYVSRGKRSDYIAACYDKRCGVKRENVPFTVVTGAPQETSQDRGWFRIERL